MKAASADRARPASPPRRAREDTPPRVPSSSGRSPSLEAGEADYGEDVPRAEPELQPHPDLLEMENANKVKWSDYLPWSDKWLKGLETIGGCMEVQKTKDKHNINWWLSCTLCKKFIDESHLMTTTHLENLKRQGTYRLRNWLLLGHKMTGGTEQHLLRIKEMGYPELCAELSMRTVRQRLESLDEQFLDPGDNVLKHEE